MEVEKEIESVLRKSHTEQFDWLENKFGLKLRVDLKVWPVFVEVTERRNLFVHSNGMVSHQYLEVCKRHGSIPDPDIIPGKVLSVTRPYFDAAHECLFEVGVKLAQVLWRKVQPSDLEHSDSRSSTEGWIRAVRRGTLQNCALPTRFLTETLKKHGQRGASVVDGYQ